LTESEGQHLSEYDPAVSEALLAEAADIVRAFGFAASHVVLIGGLVPGLLVPVLDPGIEPHIGTADIDLCLSLALVEGDTDEYERMELTLKRLGFEETEDSFRWRRTSDLPMTVEFFCPAGVDRPPGRAFRPSAEDNPVGKHNMGGRLSALALEAGDLLTTDTERISREIALPREKGTLEISLQVTGPVAFLAAKALALVGRDKPKDAYDLVWLIESWPDGPAAAAAAFSIRPAFADLQFQAALTQIAYQFATVDRVGPRSYARFRAEAVEEEPLLARRAVGAIDEFMSALPTAGDPDSGEA
jgi:hypothetical protein